jgi:hypothetical protein
MAFDGIGNSAQSTAITVNTTDPTTSFEHFIDFQPASSTVAAGYLEDDGALFGNRGNGLSYGWNFDCAAARAIGIWLLISATTR